MSDYGDHYRDMQHQNFLNKWVPRERCKELGLAPDGEARWYLARALAAETRLKEVNGALAVLRGME